MKNWKLWEFVNRNKLIIFLVFVSFFILGYPIFLYEIDKSFFNHIDPDVVYTTNALLYSKARIVSYLDHPGTPSILLFSYTFLPLRLIAKYIFHQRFIQWAFDNYAFLTFYLRCFQLLITEITIFVFLKLVQSVKDSKTTIIFAFLTLFSSGVLSWCLSIAPEPLSLFLTMTWLILLVNFLKSPKYLFISIMALISGIAFANKFTNLFLVVFTILLPIFKQKTKAIKKITAVLSNCILFLVSFFVSIWPVVHSFKYIFIWGKSLFLHAGNHGQGVAGVFDWNSYSSSISSLFRSNVLVFIIIFLAISVIVGLIAKKRIKINDRPVLFLFFLSLGGFLIFAKYPSIHYNFVNITLIIFCFIFFLTNIKLSLRRLLLGVMFILFMTSSIKYIKNINVMSNIKQTETVNGVLNAWTPFWSADIFREQLNTVGYPIKP